MKWETKKLENGKWGVFLLQKYCKTDEPVCYCASINERGADRCVVRLNNPGIYYHDLNYVSVGMMREKARKAKAEAAKVKAEARKVKAEARKAKAEAAKVKAEARKKK